MELKSEFQGTITEAVEHVKSRRGRDVPWDVAMKVVEVLEEQSAAIETAEILSDPEAMTGIRKAQEEMARGGTGITPEELEAKLDKPRTGGQLKGQIQIAPDFDAPMALVEDRGPTGIEITHDPAVCRAVLISMIEALNNGPKSRERSLAITKLQEAFMWLGEAMRLG